MKTFVNGTEVEKATELEHFKAVLTASGSGFVPCECAEWTEFDDEGLGAGREWIGFRNWTAELDCECEGMGSIRRVDA